MENKSIETPQLKANRIATRLADMPKAYRRNYEMAMAGNSRKAAMKAFCLECVMWQRNEVKLCPSIACPLYPYRPFQDTENASQGVDYSAETQNSFHGE